MKNIFLKNVIYLSLIVPSLGSFVSADSGIGVGPVKEIKLGPIDPKLAEKGKTTFTAKCSACHKIEERYVAPALKGVTLRRKPEWIMNMALNPAQMLEEDETAKGLLAEFMTPMTFQNVTQDEVRGILEFFRQNDEKKAGEDKKPPAKK